MEKFLVVDLKTKQVIRWFYNRNWANRNKRVLEAGLESKHPLNSIQVMTPTEFRNL